VSLSRGADNLAEEQDASECCRAVLAKTFRALVGGLVAERKRDE
jgi:hypothetical protein